MLHTREDDILEIWLHDYEGSDGFLKMAKLLEDKFNGKVIEKISVDVDVWRFLIGDKTLSLVYDEFSGNTLVSRDNKSDELLKQIYKKINEINNE